MLLPFSDSLIISHKYDPELARLADRHYSRQKVGTPQFMPPGKTLVIRDHLGLIVFGWLWQRPEYRDDRQVGFCCSIFRNESSILSSTIIVRCVEMVIARWGVNRCFTYIDPSRIVSANPGYCFKVAGWRFVRRCSDGKHLLERTPDAL